MNAMSVARTKLVYMLALSAIIALCSYSGFAQVYMGAVDDSRSSVDRWFYLLKRTSDNRWAVTDSSWIFAGSTGFRYHLKDSNVYWIFQHSEGFSSDSSVRLLKMKIISDRLVNDSWLDLPITNCSGLSGCEFLSEYNGSDILSCYRSDIVVDLKMMMLKRLVGD